MKKTIAYIIIILTLGLWSVTNLLAETYYVDATNGNDNNDGTSPVTAWKTWGKVTGESYVAGDTITFKRGETWNITYNNYWNFTFDGTAGNYITIEDYGSGNKPIWEAREIIGGNTGDWTDAGGNKWYTTRYSTIVRRVILDSDEWAEAPTLNDIDGSKYRWFWDSVNDRLYVYATQNPANAYSTIRICRIDRNIQLIGVNYLNIRNINMIGGGINIFVYGSCSYINIEYNDIEYTSSENGIYLHGGGGTIHHVNVRNNVIDGNTNFVDGAVPENRKPCNDGIQLRDSVHDCIVENNEIYDFAHTGLSLHGSNSSMDGVYDNIVQDNLVDGSKSFYMRGFNVIGVEDKCRNNILRRNWIQNTNVCNHSGGNNNEIYNNVIVHVTESPCSSRNDSSWGVNFQGWIYDGKTYVCHDNKLYNNVIYDIYNAAIRIVTNDNVPVEDNLIRNNILVPITGRVTDSVTNIGVYWAKEVDESNIVEYNCFYDADTEDVIRYKWEYYTVAEADSSLAEFTNNISSDPLLMSNYSLQDGSPCIDVGESLSTVADDYVQIPRPQGSGYDIGAYEYISGNVPSEPTGLRIQQ